MFTYTAAAGSARPDEAPGPAALLARPLDAPEDDGTSVLLADEAAVLPDGPDDPAAEAIPALVEDAGTPADEVPWSVPGPVAVASLPADAEDAPPPPPAAPDAGPDDVSPRGPPSK